MNLIRIAGLASVGFAVLVEPALAGTAPALVRLPGLVCLHSFSSAAHTG